MQAALGATPGIDPCDILRRARDLAERNVGEIETTILAAQQARATAQQVRETIAEALRNCEQEQAE